MDNYPMMSASELEAAPFNQEPVPEREFEVTVSQTLSRTVRIMTDDYIHVVTHEPHNRVHEDYADTSYTDWRKAYENADFKIQDLLKELESYAENDLAMTASNSGKNHYLRRLIAACKGWVEDEYEVIES